MGRPLYMAFDENQIRTLLRHMTRRMAIYKIVKEELTQRDLWNDKRRKRHAKRKELKQRTVQEGVPKTSLQDDGVSH